MFSRVCIVAGAVLTFCTAASASRDILADAHYDKLRGMWLGQILGNYAGRPTEGQFTGPEGNPAEDVDWGSFIHTSPWTGDDDTSLEYMYEHLLAGTSTPTNADIKASWETHVPLPSFFIANKQARWLMADGLVDGADYTIWADHFGESLGGAAPAPEPATMLWILLGAFPLLRRVRWGWPTARGP